MILMEIKEYWAIVNHGNFPRKYVFEILIINFFQNYFDKHFSNIFVLWVTLKILSK